MRTRLEALSNQWRVWLLVRARRLCESRADAEDLVQETLARFTAAFQDDAELPAENLCAAWLITTMMNRFYDQVRHQRARERSAAELARSLEMDEEPSPDSRERSVEERITGEQLRIAIQSLSPVLRRTLALRLEGRKHREIGWECGVAPGTVGKRLFDAREKLRLLLGLTPQREDS